MAQCISDCCASEAWSDDILFGMPSSSTIHFLFWMRGGSRGLVCAGVVLNTSQSQFGRQLIQLAGEVNVDPLPSVMQSMQSTRYYFSPGSCVRSIADHQVDREQNRKS